MAKYFYSYEGRTLGPVNPKEIMSLILEDRLNNDSYVMENKTPTWKKIRDIPDLMRFLHESDVKLTVMEEGFIADDAENEKAPLFFNIPTNRLIIWSILSMGWYEVYWFYLNWKFLRYQRTRKTSKSFWRDAINPFALVGVFYTISVDKELSKAGSKRDLSSNGWLWFLSMILLSIFSSGIIYFLLRTPKWLEMLISIALLGFSVWCILPIQIYIHDANTRLGRGLTKHTFGHYAIIAMGLLGWFISLSSWIPALMKLLAPPII